jgi:ribonuclease R
MLSREQVLALLRERVHHPATARELLQVLQVSRQDRATLRRHLKALVASGDLIQIRGNRFGLADRMDVVVGRLQTHPRGYGFVVPDTGREGGPDIYVSAPNLKEALHGDRVVARIERRHADDRVEGRIIRILERANTTVVGRFDLDETGLGFVMPFDRRLLADVQVPRADVRGAAPGEMVVVELTRWPTATRPPLGRVIEVLGASTRRASTRRSSSASTAFPTSTATRRSARRGAWARW